jgi:putative hydrolase of the HAD superfamily
MIDWSSIRSVFFDLDNTLIDHTGAEQRAFEMCFERCEFGGGEYTCEELLGHYRRINNDLWSAYRRGEVTTDEVRHERFRRVLSLQFPYTIHSVSTEKVSEVYLSLYDTASIPLDGAMEAIDLAKKRYGFVGIITNGFPRQVARKLEHHRWTATFDVVIISSLVGVAKPHPDVFKTALATRNHEPGEAVYIGDNFEVDVVGAKNAGWKAIYVRNDHDAEGTSIRPDLTVSSLRALHPLLART